jgi:phage portal protein BeeE
VKIEQSISKDLLSEKDRKRYFAKFNVNGLLRGDIAARKDFYQVMLQNGVYSPNMVLEREDENTFDGGDIHMVNGAMIPVNMLEEVLKSKVKSAENAQNDSKNTENIKKGGENDGKAKTV